MHYFWYHLQADMTCCGSRMGPKATSHIVEQERRQELLEEFVIQYSKNNSKQQPQALLANRAAWLFGYCQEPNLSD